MVRSVQRPGDEACWEDERMKMSWVTIDRFCQEETEVNEDIRHELERNGKPLRSSAESLTDDELLTKLRDLGVDGDRDGVERLCEGALSAEEAARPILDKLRLGDDIAGDWVWICLRRALIDFCEESLRRFPCEDQLTTENRRRALAGAYFDVGLTEKAEGLFQSWLDADPGWGWGWIGWADCYLPWGGEPKDFGRAEKLLRRGYLVPGVRDRADIAERLQHLCEDTGRPGEARRFGEQARRLQQGPARSPARSAPSPGDTARTVKVGRNSPCPCGSAKKFKKCCGSPLIR
jgi:SEC-C motif